LLIDHHAPVGSFPTQKYVPSCCPHSHPMAAPELQGWGGRKDGFQTEGCLASDTLLLNSRSPVTNHNLKTSSLFNHSRTNGSSNSAGFLQETRLRGSRLFQLDDQYWCWIYTTYGVYTSMERNFCTFSCDLKSQGEAGLLKTPNVSQEKTGPGKLQHSPSLSSVTSLPLYLSFTKIQHRKSQENKEQY